MSIPHNREHPSGNLQWPSGTIYNHEKNICSGPERNLDLSNITPTLISHNNVP